MCGRVCGCEGLFLFVGSLTDTELSAPLSELRRRLTCIQSTLSGRDTSDLLENVILQHFAGAYGD